MRMTIQKCKWKKCLAVFLSFTLLAGHALAQTMPLKISGTIINERTSAPASGATVTVKNTNRYTTVDTDGKFSIEASKGDVLIITMVGFQKTQMVVGKNNSVEIKLAENAVQLEGNS